MAAVREPQSCLIGLIDMPLRIELPAPLHERLRALRATIKAGVAPDGWAALYREAVDCGETLVAHLDTEVSRTEQEALSMPDPNDVRGRLLTAPMKQAEAQRKQATTDLKRVLTDWTDRVQRQRPQVVQQCAGAKASLLVPEVQREGRAATVSYPAGGWGQYQSFVVQCVEAWSQQSIQGATAELDAVVSSYAVPAGTGMAAPSLPAALAPPRPGLSSLQDSPAGTAGAVPSVGGALFGFLRSNLLLVSMFGMMLAAPITVMFGLDLGSGGAARGYIVVGALPFLGVAGILAGRKKQKDALGDLLQKGTSALDKHVDKALSAELDVQTSAIQRALVARHQSLEDALDAWVAATLRPHFETLAPEASDALRRAKLDQRRVSDAHNRARKMRDDVQAKLLFELRKALRFYTE